MYGTWAEACTSGAYRLSSHNVLRSIQERRCQLGYVFGSQVIWREEIEQGPEFRLIVQVLVYMRLRIDSSERPFYFLEIWSWKA